MTDEELLDYMQSILDEMRPNIQMDGGDVILDKFEDGVVYLLFEGECATSQLVFETVKSNIETRLKEEIPEVVEVIAAKQ